MYSAVKHTNNAAHVGEDRASRHLQWIFEMILAITSRHKKWYGIMADDFSYLKFWSENMI